MRIYGHRGSSLRYPENTMAAFRAALEEGATGIETDLRLTLDGVIVLAHDPDLARIAGNSRRVSDLTLGELEMVRIEGKHAVPTLEQFWAVARCGADINLEVKERRVTTPLLRFLRSHDGAVLVTSFHLTVIDRVRKALPGVPVGPVLRRLGPREMERVRGRGYRAVSLRADSFSGEALDFCRSEGLLLLLWVVNEPERVLHFEGLGVDGVFTDCPGPVMRALSEKGFTGGKRVR